MLDTGYRANLAASDLIDCLSQLVKQERSVEHLLCRYLADLADRLEEEPALLAGYSDIYHAARCLFGMGVRRTRDRVRIGRALRELPHIEQAFVTGELGYSRVREVTRVARREDESLWLSRGVTLPMRQLEQRVAQAGDAEGYRERAANKAREPATLSWRSRNTVEVRLTMTAQAWALLERAMEGARRAADVGADGMLSDSEALEAVARDALAKQQQDQSDDAADPRRVVVLYECKRCEQTELDTGAGSVVLDRATAASLGCLAKVRDLDTEGRIEKRGGDIPAAVMRAVRLRDRNRCRNPHCGRRRYVDVHHIEYREDGGVHSRTNLCVLCSTCHHKLHARELFIEGNADEQLVFYNANRERIGPVARRDPIGARIENLNGAAQRVLAVMDAKGAWHPDVVADATGLAIREVSETLLMLELDGHLRRDLSGSYQRINGLP